MVWMYNNLYIGLANGHLHYFCFGIIVNKDMMNILAHVFLTNICFPISSVNGLKKELLVHLINTCKFKNSKTHQIISQSGHVFSIPIQSS